MKSTGGVSMRFIAVFIFAIAPCAVFAQTIAASQSDRRDIAQRVEGASAYPATHHSGDVSTKDFLVPHLVVSQEIGNVFSRTLSFSVPGYDPFVRRVSGTAAYRVTKTNPDGFLLAGRFMYDGSPVNTGDTFIKDGGRTICYKDQCSPSTDASGVTINPALWGGYPDKAHPGQSWNVEIATLWELGPPGKETVSVLAIDPATGMIRLRRNGSGEGLFADDTKQIPLTANGIKTIVNVRPGRATWTGYATFCKGVVVSDALLVERSIQVVANGQTITGTERQYVLLNSIDPEMLWKE